MSGSRRGTTFSPAFVCVLVAVAAGIGLFGVRTSPVIPAMARPWSENGMVLPQAVLGLPLLVGGAGLAVSRAVDRRVLRAMAAGVGLAAVAGVVAGIGMLPLEAGLWCVRLTFAGLLVAQIAAAVAIGAGAGIGRWPAVLGVGLIIVAIVALSALSVHPLPGPLADRGPQLGQVMAVSMPAGIWALFWIGTLASIRRRPEYGGHVLRPPVRLRCPRCGCRQRQRGAEGCRRCGLDVRIEPA